MNNLQMKHFSNALHHIYINPLEKCNLDCAICYTKKTAQILTREDIVDFIDRYNREVEAKVVTFCGGEVSVLPYFPGLVNDLTQRGIFVQIITNGTVDRLEEYKKPNSVNFIVSIDGPREHHDRNRGEGRFEQSISYLEKAKQMGFHGEVFTVVTQDNLRKLDVFEEYLKNRVGEVQVTYHPRKPLNYLNIHPVSNIHKDKRGFGFLSEKQISQLMDRKTVFPPATLGCYQVALVSDGTVYGCCEGFDPIGKREDDINTLIKRLQARVEGPCSGCTQATFMCGIRSIIEAKNNGKI